MKIIATTVLIMIFSGAAVFSQSFDDYKKIQNESYKKSNTFDTYKKDINKDFQSYKRIATEEFAKFSGKVKKEWGDNVITTDKIWVEYSPDMQTRRIVNFETGEITIQLKKDIINADKATFAKEVALLITESSATAFKNDQVSNNVENRMKSEGIEAEYSILPNTPILLELVSDIKNPSGKDIANAAIKLVNGSSITTETLENGQKVATLNGSISVETPASGKGAVLTANKDIGAIHKKAPAFKDIVEKYAAARKMPEALVYAVIHNESSFNPTATSHVPAYGMMQLVPTSGGKEASSVYFGKPVVLGPSYFYNPDNNIKLGSTYLSQLYYIYFKNITNPETRLYCTISAYNTGPGNVSRAFTGSKNLPEAIKVINAMTPQAAYNKLIASLPYSETKTYLKRVSSSYNAYYGY